MINKSKLFYPILVRTAVIAYWTIGYMLIEDWSLLDSLYMTVINLTTVVYEEVHVLSDKKRLFSIVFMISGIGAMSLNMFLKQHQVSGAAQSATGYTGKGHTPTG